MENLMGILESTESPAIIAVILFFVVLGILKSLKVLMQVCSPNEILIFSGRRNTAADGITRGYRVIFGGRGLRFPIVEKAQKMQLNSIIVPITIKAAYSKGGIPLDVNAIATTKISSSPELVGNAIERFLGHGEEEIRRVAKETLEGHLRGVLATLTPEEINEDRLKFSESLTHESAEDLSKLGLQLDSLKILHVSDEVGYLNSIGREAIANVIKDAEMAESDATREAELIEAANAGRAGVIEANVEAKIAQMENELRRYYAELESKVHSEEERTVAGAREARAKAEQELQQDRIILQSFQLEADVILPAKAHKEAQKYLAQGKAAQSRENGYAAALVMKEMQHAWKEAGPFALQLTLINEIERILAIAAEGAGKFKAGQLNIVDGTSGKAVSNYMENYLLLLKQMFTALEVTTGIDVPSVLKYKEAKI